MKLNTHTLSFQKSLRASNIIKLLLFNREVLSAFVSERYVDMFRITFTFSLSSSLFLLSVRYYRVSQRSERER